MAGDESLKDEIDANAQSSSPVARMARASVQVNGEEERDCKRRRLMEDAAAGPEEGRLTLLLIASTKDAAIALRDHEELG